MTARLLAIMGSGETSPTMVKVHRSLLARLGPPPVPAVVLDTPFGFQANADELTARAVAYFAESVGAELGVASFRSAAGSALERETAVERIRSARYVFAGPGSPSYALRQWDGTAVAAALADKLAPAGPAGGGCVTFASAAALTLGVATVPVYEIYKVGEDPHWLAGLDLLSAAGLSAAVIPHYNNAEGGTHDTRFCYLGEERLSRMESELPDGAFVLGVDEHTGLVLDLAEGTASVVGIGVVTVRRAGRSEEVPSGTTVPIADLARLASVRSGAAGAGGPAAAPVAAGAGVDGPAATSPLLDRVAGLESSFDAAIAAGDSAGAAGAVLELDEELVSWAQETFSSDEMARARAALRSMIVRLGAAAEGGLRDPAEVVGPFVEALLDQRTAARADKRWADADTVRDRLTSMGVEVRDGPDGTTWVLHSSPGSESRAPIV